MKVNGLKIFIFTIISHCLKCSFDTHAAINSFSINSFLVLNILKS